MKKIINVTLLAIFISFLAFNCTKTNGNIIEASKSEAKVKANPTSNEENNCLEQFNGKPEELLTAELVAEFIDFAGAEVKVEKVSEQIIRDKDYATVNCQWKIDRARHIVRLQSISKIKLYDKTPVEQFHFQYHTRTADEQAEQKKALDAQVSKETTNENADDVTGSVGFDFQYEKIAALGDAAVWEHKVNNLIVLVGAYQFTVNVNLKGSNALHLEKAQLIAQAIIKKACR